MEKITEIIYYFDTYQKTLSFDESSETKTQRALEVHRALLKLLNQKSEIAWFTISKQENLLT